MQQIISSLKPQPMGSPLEITKSYIPPFLACSSRKNKNVFVFVCVSVCMRINAIKSPEFKWIVERLR